MCVKTSSILKIIYFFKPRVPDIIYETHSKFIYLFSFHVMNTNIVYFFVCGKTKYIYSSMYQKTCTISISLVYCYAVFGLRVLLFHDDKFEIQEITYISQTVLSYPLIILIYIHYILLIVVYYARYMYIYVYIMNYNRLHTLYVHIIQVRYILVYYINYMYMYTVNCNTLYTLYVHILLIVIDYIHYVLLIVIYYTHYIYILCLHRILLIIVDYTHYIYIYC